MSNDYPLHRHHHHHHRSSPRPQTPISLYEERVRKMSENGYARLTYLLKFLQSENNPVGEVNCTILEGSPDGKGLIETPKGSPHFEDLKKSIKSRPPETLKTIFILEDLSTEWIIYLGELLSIDPYFFANHLRHEEFGHLEKYSHPHMLPSCRKLRKFTFLNYFEPVVLDEVIENLTEGELEINCHRVVRFRTVEDDRKKKTVAFVLRYVSLWIRKYGNGCWAAVLLTDPPFGEYIPLKVKMERQTRHLDLTWYPYGGGYMEFAPWPENLQHKPIVSSPAHRSIKSELMRYLNANFPASPSASTLDDMCIILQKIILSQWMLVLAFMSRDLRTLYIHRIPGSDWDEVEKIVHNLMSFRSVIRQSHRMMRRNLLNLGINPTDELYFAGWKAEEGDKGSSCDCDWAYICRELRERQDNAVLLIDGMFHDITVIDSKRAESEADRERQEEMNVARMTALGAFLVPMSVTSGIFSMAAEFSPGGNKFWLFWVISLPFSILLIVWWQLLNHSGTVSRKFMARIEKRRQMRRMEAF